MKYKIDWCEIKTTSTGKKKIDATLIDEKGVKNDKVTIWEGFPNFENLAAGMEIDADVVEKQNGQYLNKTAYAIKAPSTGFKGGAGVKAAQERKGEMIKEAQSRKNEAIAFFNATNCAMQLLPIIKTELDNPFKVKEAIKHWREWFLCEWQEYEVKDTTDKHRPF